MIKNFNELMVWQKSHDLALEIYKITNPYPEREWYGLVSQMRRSATSIAANIAEGSKKRTTSDLLHFLNIAEGSLEELKYYLLLSSDLGYITRDSYREYLDRTEEIGKMLSGLKKSLSGRKAPIKGLVGSLLFIILTLPLSIPHLPLTTYHLPLITYHLLHAAVFEDRGLGARSAGMGSGFAAVSGDQEAVYWNPAGLATIQNEKMLHSGYRNLYGLGILRHITSGYIQPGLGRGVVGFSWYRLDTMGDASFLDYAENTIVFSYGTNVLHPLHLGVNGKYYRVNSTLGASGMGLDFGLIYVVKEPYLQFGASVQDLTRTMISWDSGVKERLPVHLRFGASGRVFSNTFVAAQVAWKDQKNQSHHLGVEQEFFKRVFTIRLGGIERGGDLRFSWGLGLRFKGILLDYAWEREKYLGDTQVYSLSLRF